MKKVYHSITRPSSLSDIEGLAQYFPVIPSMSLKPRRIGIFAASASNSQSQAHSVIASLQSKSCLPAVLVGVPTLLPISVNTQPGQQAFMSNPGFSRASTAENEFMAALLTPYAILRQPFSYAVPLSTHFWQSVRVLLSQRTANDMVFILLTS